ncbi:hypothetical protein HBN50_04600 [Halobacteriovorax sp. GB3]|uniref:hypothetical protein n=1 Tax=Halobacteriovorax sp. GB3 TaxID=2719615 RepID=UPI00235DD33F|nr:hypothetical protein [Halobacteriovorax sp. GB3]MDD0852363.1 hypothetical protein [Halobacteriovorax sp. GB3]
MKISSKKALDLINKDLDVAHESDALCWNEDDFSFQCFWKEGAFQCISIYRSEDKIKKLFALSLAQIMENHSFQRLSQISLRELESFLRDTNIEVAFDMNEAQDYLEWFDYLKDRFMADIFLSDLSRIQRFDDLRLADKVKIIDAWIGEFNKFKGELYFELVAFHDDQVALEVCQEQAEQWLSPFCAAMQRLIFQTSSRQKLNWVAQ